MDLFDALGVEVGFVTAIAATGDDFNDRDDTAFYVGGRLRPEIFVQSTLKSLDDFGKWVGNWKCFQ